MNRDWVLYHLREAEGELRRIIADVESTPDFSRWEFGAMVPEVYHHVNTAWNSQDESEAVVRECAPEDFERWRQFPTDVHMGTS